MYKIKTKLVVYCLVYFLPVRIPEIGVKTTLHYYLKLNRVKTKLYLSEGTGYEA